MTGVEILTSAQVAVDAAFNWIVFWGTIAISIIIAIGIIIDLRSDLNFNLTDKVIVFFLSIMFGLIFGYLGGWICTTNEIYETRYNVTISDEVLMKDFYEHYEVIDQDGKIFTVREKINESN